MSLFTDDKHQYWENRVNNVYLLKDLNLNNNLLSVIDSRALSLLFIIIILFNNNNSYIDIDNFLGIPASKDDLKVASIILNQYFLANNLNHKVLILRNDVALISI